MAVDHERRAPHEYEDYIDRAPASYNASGWGVVLGVIALFAILGMLLIGIGNSPNGNAPQTSVERTAPAPTPAPTPAPAPTTSPAPN
ncbi:MAG: hypothetical protein J0I75_09950 [Hyphomicrobium sp.]|nr:hypothetical protein [Hyphomicrobium sp.]ODT19778.1 MAG: hypothetical protein ABS54_14695 [Hyphomicrobium sp. SCN 65-11]